MTPSLAPTRRHRLGGLEAGAEARGEGEERPEREEREENREEKRREGEAESRAVSRPAGELGGKGCLHRYSGAHTRHRLSSKLQIFGLKICG